MSVHNTSWSEKREPNYIVPRELYDALVIMFGEDPETFNPVHAKGWVFFCRLVHNYCTKNPFSWITASERYRQGVKLSDFGVYWHGVYDEARGSLIMGEKPDFGDKLFMYTPYQKEMPRKFMLAPRVQKLVNGLTIDLEPLTLAYDTNLYTGKKVRNIKHKVKGLSQKTKELVQSLSARPANHDTLRDHKNLAAALYEINPSSERKAEATLQLNKYRDLLSKIFDYDPISGIGWYYHSFKETSTGRIQELGINLQGAARQMKTDALIGVEHYNYDIASSQISFLKQLAQEFDIDTAWIDKFSTQKKSDIADRVGIPQDDFKECLYALVFGSCLREKSRPYFDEDLMERVDDKPSAVWEVLLRGYSDPTEALNRLEIELGGLAEIVNKMRKVVKSKEFHEKYGFVNSEGEQLRNAMCMNIPRSERSAKILAHFLQGIETHFVTTLSVLAPNYGYDVFSYEADGLITGSEIPDEAVQATKALTGSAEYIQLKEKPLSGLSDLEKFLEK